MNCKIIHDNFAFQKKKKKKVAKQGWRFHGMRLSKQLDFGNVARKFKSVK
jgi:hypothetical protein